MKFICSSILLLSGLLGSGQAIDSAKIRDWKPSFIRIGYDVSRLGTTLFTDRFRQEGVLEFDTDRYFINAEIGYERNEWGDSFDYTSKGTYYRFGVDANLIRFDKSRHVISMGFKYAFSRYSDELRSTIDNVILGEQQVTVGNSDVRASWFEIVTNLKARLSKNLYIGYVLRIKTFQSIKGFEDLKPYDIPGFGKARKSTTVGFNYHIFWTIPFREKFIPTKPRRVD
ncbi:MAG: hypothetical protein KI790_00880 [Cyclobacteriaceae bacterium]|nr:hypothetical protein [Cyclobacteriaceae bacterium HetDA_MAG_MS6]